MATKNGTDADTPAPPASAGEAKRTKNGAKSKSSSSSSSPAGARSKQKRHVLFTGYPGFISKRLLRRLFEELPNARFTLLVEERQRAAADADLALLAPDKRKRVKVTSGDVTKMDLGLAGLEIDALKDVSLVFHLAAVQKVEAPHDVLENVNVHGTRNVLAFAGELEHLERFVHFSTALVSGDREGVIT